ncbi:hypothetical protein [Aureimonas mangrovi]|uniref:hypothetical protein n=1 Tax=Aureimonas mangrovi TaxID=2758041 RepID=UPI00163DB268|nr:hypothetical protein [Aureimonas mangrovi]
MPERLKDLSPGAIKVLQWAAREDVCVNLVPAEMAAFLEILKARNLIQYDEETGMLAVVRLTPDGQRLYEEGRF